MTKQFKAMKFRIANPEQSARLQEVLFKLAYRWFKGLPTTAQHTDRYYFYVGSNGYMSYGTDGDFFDNKEFEEKDTEQFIAEHSKPVLVKHKWYDVIVAAAEGKVIQVMKNGWKDLQGEEVFTNCSFFNDNEYRVKPETVDVWQWAYMQSDEESRITFKFYETEGDVRKSYMSPIKWLVKLEPTKKTVEK